jgi:predicted nucleotidyltransferase
MELSLGWLPFEREAMAHAEKVDLMGVSVPIARAEDLVIYKAVAWRERDRSDIERLLIAHRDQIDLQRVRRVVREFADALDEPARIVEFDGLIERAIGLSAR